MGTVTVRAISSTMAELRCVAPRCGVPSPTSVGRLLLRLYTPTDAEVEVCCPRCRSRERVAVRVTSTGATAAAVTHAAR